MMEELIMAYFKELSWHVLRRLEENRIENTLASI
jgi:hypothetical protein